MRSTRILASLAAMALTMAVAAPAWAADPQGNNGTIKVSNRDIDTIPDNEPHQGCTFDVEFFGYDNGALYATATFAVIRSCGDLVVLEDEHIFIGEDAASGAGTSTGIDATEEYDLNDELAPFVADGNVNQGVHVRLTVTAQGSNGADTKHKVFWAKGCEVEQQET